MISSSMLKVISPEKGKEVVVYTTQKGAQDVSS